MADHRAANKLWAGLALVVVLGAAGLSVWQRANEPVGKVMPAGMNPPVVPVVSAPPPVKRRPAEKPFWTDLTPAQQRALEPLKDEWNTIEGVRKKKWLEIAKRYARMTPEEQKRAHERMRDLYVLTPEQRRAVRENLAKVTNKTDAGKKHELWEQYQQLSEEEKKKLAAEAASKKLVANIPTPAQAKVKTVAPVKINPAEPAPSPAPGVTVPASAPAVPGPAAAPAASTPAAPVAPLPSASAGAASIPSGNAK